MISKGGIWHWRKVIYAAMRLQSLNALGQAGLLVGADRIVRLDAPTSEQKIGMDDWKRAREELPPAAVAALDAAGDSIACRFLSSKSLTRKELGDFSHLWLVVIASYDGATRCRGLKSPVASIGATG
jgi:hypothetical protein